MYVKRSEEGFVILSLYVDVILIARNDMELIVTTKGWLSSNFEMKDMGEANYVLGVKILGIILKDFTICPKRLTLRRS